MLEEKLSLQQNINKFGKNDIAFKFTKSLKTHKKGKLCKTFLSPALLIQFQTQNQQVNLFQENNRIGLGKQSLN